MRPRHKGDFYDKPNSYTFLNLRPARSRPVRVRPARVRPARVRPARVRPARVRPPKNEARNGVRPKSIIIDPKHTKKGIFSQFTMNKEISSVNFVTWDSNLLKKKKTILMQFISVRGILSVNFAKSSILRNSF